MRPRIFIVDDNPTNLRLATDILEDAGCRIDQAGDAEQALAMLADFTPDLILMDIALPGADGLSLTRRLKSDARFHRIPIVALTASAMKGDEEKALAAGCHAYITKPIDTRRFAQQILGYLPAIPAAAAGKVILIVDDYPANLQVLRAGLESEGFTVLDASNGVEALAVLERSRVDGVVSDILMPTMDGFRFCHEIRKSSNSYAAVPFILYTATYNSPSDRELAKTVGADGYIVKPAPIAVIVAALGQARLQTRDLAQPAVQKLSDSYVLERYSAALVRKLEERNAELQLALARISDLNLHLEERVAQRTAELNAINKALYAFSHSAAHDLRAPLSHVSMNAELLQEAIGSQLNASCRGYLDTIISGSDRMGQLISDLLRFSRSGREEFQRLRVELDEVVQESLAALQPEVLGRNIEWRRAPLPAVIGDRAMLRQVFVNMLSNAIKYTRKKEPALIEILQTSGTTEEVVVFVRDNGVGFDMAQAGELFKVFQRLHAGADFEGTGVGLAICHQIITRHGGRMWAEATVGRGATFYIGLPAA